MRERSLILDICVGPLFHVAVLFSVYLLFRGHNAPGGGFIGGLVAGAALVLRYVSGGPDEARRTVPLAPENLLGVGLLLAAGTGVAPWLTGDQFLESAKVSVDLGWLGTVKATSALPFDIGVFFVVVGLVLAVLRTLGDET